MLKAILDWFRKEPPYRDNCTAPYKIEAPEIITPPKEVVKQLQDAKPAKITKAKKTTKPRTKKK